MAYSNIDFLIYIIEKETAKRLNYLNQRDIRHCIRYMGYGTMLCNVY